MKHMLLARTLTTCALMAAVAACTVLTTGCGGGHPEDHDDADLQQPAAAVSLCVLADSRCGSPAMLVRNHEQGHRTWRVTGSACWATSTPSARAADVMTAARNTPACGTTARSQVVEISTSTGGML